MEIPCSPRKIPEAGELRGVAVDLARELGTRIHVPVELVGYDSAGKMFEAVKAGAWDVAFLAIDPGRADEIDFTAPYVEIQGTYLVPAVRLCGSSETSTRPTCASAYPPRVLMTYS